MREGAAVQEPCVEGPIADIKTNRRRSIRPPTQRRHASSDEARSEV